MNLSEIKQRLTSFEITGCNIAYSGDLVFIAQNWDNQDSMDLHSTFACVYMPLREKAKQWQMMDLGDFYDMLIIRSGLENENWVLVSNLGDMCVVRKNEAEFEESISTLSPCVWGGNGYVDSGGYFVGPGRNITQRTAPNSYKSLMSKNIKSTNVLEDKGFKYIDKFSSSDIYVAGGYCDLWHYNGEDWNFLHLPSNRPIRGMCCGSDGLVYILVANRFLFVGRDNVWAKVTFDEFDDSINSIYWYQDHLVLLTKTVCYKYADKTVTTSEIIVSSPLKYYLKASFYKEKILLSNANEAALFNGENWSQLL